MLADNLIRSPSVQLQLLDVEVESEVNTTIINGKKTMVISVGSGLQPSLLGIGLYFG